MASAKVITRYKAREWLLRYSVLEVIGTVFALGGAWFAIRITGSLVAAAIVGSVAEAIGFYAAAFAHDVLHYYRLRAQRAKTHRFLAAAWEAIRGLLFEFGPAEALDGFLVRPWLFYLIPTVFGGPVFLGIFIAKILADVIFYTIAIIGYELNKKIFIPDVSLAAALPTLTLAAAPGGAIGAARHNYVVEEMPVLTRKDDILSTMQPSASAPSTPRIRQIIDNFLPTAQPTPFLLMDMAAIGTAYDAFRVALPEATVYYAVKCNPSLSIVNYLLERGSHFEIASYPELLLLQQAGADPAQVIFSNPIKRPMDIANTYKAGLRTYAFDSLAEIDKLAAHAPGARVYVRLKTSPAESQLASEGKFGVGVSECIVLMQAALAKGLRPYGIGFHVGSQMDHPGAWATAIEHAGDLMRQLDAINIHLEYLDLGGGFPAHYSDSVPELAAFTDTIKAALTKLPYSVHLGIEPGRALVADAGTMVATIIGVADRGDKRWLHLDVGAFNGMIESLESVNKLRFPITDSKAGGETRQYTLTGPSCDSQDTILFDAELSVELTVGDIVFIHTAGAYTTAYASNFNGFDIPQTICVS